MEWITPNTGVRVEVAEPTDMEKKRKRKEKLDERDRLWQIKLAEHKEESLRLQRMHEMGLGVFAKPSTAVEPIKPEKPSKPSKPKKHRQTDPKEDARNVQYGTSFNWKEFGF